MVINGINGLSMVSATYDEVAQVFPRILDTIDSSYNSNQAGYWVSTAGNVSYQDYAITAGQGAWSGAYVNYAFDPATNTLEIVKDIPEWDS